MNTELIVAPESRAEAVSKGELILNEAKSLEVIFGESATYQMANDFLTSIKQGRKFLDQTFDENIDRWHKGHKSAVAEKKALETPFAEAESIIKNKMIAWKRDETDRLEEERLKQEAIAKAEAEMERKRLQAIADEEARVQRAYEADQLKQQGKAKAAAALLKKPIKADVVEMPEMAPIAAPPPTRAEGTSFRKEWDFKIVDASKLPAMYLIPDESKIRKAVKALGKDANIDGILIYQIDVMTKRA